MDEEKIKSLIRSWLEKARLETDIFSKFVFLWFCFNAWLAYKSSEYTDRAMIDWLKSNRSSDLYDSYTFIKDSEVHSVLIDELINLSPVKGEPHHPRASRRSDIKISSKEDFDNLIEAIYRIRCNLFHGKKDADLERDQELVRASGGILKAWIGVLVAQW